VRRRAGSRGFSLTELLTVVGMIGIVAIVTVPAMVQLMPQYRIRSAASDAGAGLRLLRQKAITTRTPWRVSFDATNDRYTYSKLTSPNAVRSVSTNWTKIGRDGRPSTSVQWIRFSSVDVRTNTSNAFKDVDCDGSTDVIFLRDGSVADDPNGGGCGAGANLTFTTAPSLVFAVDNRFVKYNRYYLSLTENGALTILSAKE
jgi:prepilin-type N-terminal cleavage/methylation domain-containing protein